jgi:hypothetical protein
MEKKIQLFVLFLLYDFIEARGINMFAVQGEMKILRNAVIIGSFIVTDVEACTRNPRMSGHITDRMLELATKELKDKMEKFENHRNKFIEEQKKQIDTKAASDEREYQAEQIKKKEEKEKTRLIELLAEAKEENQTEVQEIILNVQTEVVQDKPLESLNITLIILILISVFISVPFLFYVIREIYIFLYLFAQ